MIRKPATSAVVAVERRARKAGLRYVNSSDAGFTRRRCGNGFTYHGKRGKRITSARTLQRIEKLVIPPAWEEVWICRYTNGHIQCTGIDEAGRKQYLYHPQWQIVSNLTKFDRMYLIAALLPRIRRRIRADLRKQAASRERVLAAVVRLLDKAHIRIGTQRYATERGTAGATTLKPEHVEVHKYTVSLDFPGKSGQWHEIELTDPKVAQTVRACEEIDGQYLFSFRNGGGVPVDVDSTMVNRYLQEIAGETVTAKDFRTWAGSVIALAELADVEEPLSKTARKRTLVAAVDTAAEELGNTRAVCRSHYIHPGIITAFTSGELPKLITLARRTRRRPAEMTEDERLFANLLPHLTST